MKRKLLSLVMILCMLLPLFPTTALAAEAPEGYITDSNGIMAYRYRSGGYITINCIDFQGYYDGSWLQTTSHKMGFNTYLEIDDGENYRSPGRSIYVLSNTSYVNASGNPETPGIPYMKSSSGLTVDVDVNFLYDGKIIQLQYTVENTSANSVNFALGSNSRTCIQLGNTFGKLKVALFDGGLKISSESSDIQLNFWNGSDIEGVTPVDTCWYGYFDSSQKNTFTDLSNKTTLDIWPGLSWSWKNRTIAAGETQTYSVMFSMGGLGSEILTKEYSVDYSSTLGIEPENVKVEEGISVTLPVLTAAGYVFGGWYSDSALTSFVGTGGGSYTPTDNMTLYAKWTAIQSPVNTTITKDNTPWTGQSLALYQGGYYKCALNENGTSGIYSASVANGIYDIYKDGMDTGENVVVATTVTSGTGETVPMTIGYTTLTTNTQLDGIASTIPGEVDYRSGGAVVFSTTSSDGTYTVIVRDTNTSNYDVYVNALDSNQDISLIDKSITVNYFTGEVAVTLDGIAYNGRNVVLSRKVGTNTYYYTATDDDSDGVYTVMLPAGPSNDYSYTVSVNGRTLSDTVSYGDKSSTAAYYTAHVDVQKDGSDWVSDIDVYLENNGIQQKLTYTGGADYQLILFSDSGTYNVMVSGSNSTQDTGFDVSSNVVQEIDYWSVNFYTTDDTTAYTSRIIQEGKTVSKPSTPNITGKSFAGWYTTTTSDVLYDYANAIEGATDIYAKLVDPVVSINETVKETSTYTIPNLTLTGFPFTGTPIKSATSSVDSGSIAVTSGSGFTVTGSGSKTVTVKFGDEGTTPDAAQTFLRANTLCTPASTDSGGGGITYTPQALKVTIGGDTSNGNVITTTTNIFPVNLNLNGGTINSGNLSYYQEGVRASLPTDLFKSGKFFAGWYENADFSGDSVSNITTGDSGEKTYYAKWADSSPEKLIVFGMPNLSDGKFTYPNLTLAPSSKTVYSAKVSIDNGTVAVAEDVGHKVVYDSTNTTATINFGASGLTLADVQTLLRTKTSFTVTPSNEYPTVTIELDGNVTSLPSGVTVYAGDGTNGLAGHYYMYVPVSGGADWNFAYNWAKTYRYKGMKGYLVTITSAEENAILNQINGSDYIWTGGSMLKQDNEENYDTDVWQPTASIDYSWRWVCGPEAGSKFHYGFNGADNFPVDSSGKIIGIEAGADPSDPVYTNWASGEPNYFDHGGVYGRECFVETAGTTWNDLAPTFSKPGYFLEFGGYPEGQDPGEFSDDLIIRGSSNTLAPTSDGNTIYANGAALIISGANAYWDMNSDGVLDDNEDDTQIYASVSSGTTINAGTTAGYTEPPSGQITVLHGSSVGTITKGNVMGPVVVKLAGNVEATIDLDSITMVEIIDTLTGDDDDIKLNIETGDLGANRLLAIDKTGVDVIDMNKFTLNNGDNALVAVGNELQISGYGVNTQDSVTTTITGIAPTYITAIVEVRENGVLADAGSVVLKSGGTEIKLNRSATGVYSYNGLQDDTTLYTLYVDDEVVGSPYAAFASIATVNQAPNYYTAQVTYKVDGNERDAQSVVLKADGKDDITLTQQTDSDTGALVTGIYEYWALADSLIEYAVWVNGEDSGEKLKFASGDYQKTVNRYTTEVSLTNSGMWSGQSVTLCDDSGNIIYTLSETDTNGTYSVLTYSDYVGTYNIYINGRDITPSILAKTTSGTIAYMTTNVITNKNGIATRIGAVTVGGNDAIESSTGNYTITLPADSYAVNVAGTNVGNVTVAGSSLTADFYTVHYDGGGATGIVPIDSTIYFDGSPVTVLSSGELNKDGNVFAGWQMDGTTYNTGEIFTLTGAVTLIAQWSSTADAQVSWSIGDMTYYGTLSEAISAAENTGLPVRITIQNDVTITEHLTIPDNVVVTVPEGKTVTAAESVTLTNEGTINSNGTLTGEGTLNNKGTVDNTATATTGGTINIATDNSGGEIKRGTITSGVMVTGGEITGPIVNNDSGTAGNGGAAITITGGTVDIKDNGTNGIGNIIGGIGNGTSGNGGVGILVSGGTVAIDEQVGITGGSGGFGENAGSGGAGITVSGDTDITIEGIVTGGTGGYGTTSGSGGSGITVSGGADITIEGYVTGGSGGFGENAAAGGSGIANEGTGTVEVNGIVSGGEGGINNMGETAESGTSLIGTITYSVQLDSSDLTFGGSDTAAAVTQNFTLPLTDRNGISITWTEKTDTGNNINISGNRAVITRPVYGQGDKTVTLTASITINGVTETKDIEVVVKAYSPTSESNESHDDDKSTTISTAQTGTINVVVTGKTESAGIETTSTESGKLTVAVTVNNKVIESKIEEAVKDNTSGTDNLLQVPVTEKAAEVVKVELTGDIVKKLEENAFDLSIMSGSVEYVIPAEDLTISNVAKELGVK